MFDAAAAVHASAEFGSKLRELRPLTARPGQGRFQRCAAVLDLQAQSVRQADIRECELWIDVDGSPKNRSASARGFARTSGHALFAELIGFPRLKILGRNGIHPCLSRPRVSLGLQRAGNRRCDLASMANMLAAVSSRS